MQILNTYGQIYILNNWKQVENTKHPVIAYDSQKLGDIIEEKHQLDIGDPDIAFSSLRDTAFIGNVGI